jgi:hypothetical protein
LRTTASPATYSSIYDVHEFPNTFVNITEPPLDAYDLDVSGEVVEDDLEEIEEEVFNSPQSSRKKRAVNCTASKILISWCGHGRKYPSMRLPQMIKLGSAIGNGLKKNSSSSCLELLHHGLSPIDHCKAGGM